MLNVEQTAVWRLSDLGTYLGFCHCTEPSMEVARGREHGNGMDDT